MKNPTSISHFPGPQQQALLRLKNQIVKSYKPLIIYYVDGGNHHQTSWNCFSHPRNRTEWHFSCDLLLVLPEGETLSEAELKTSKFEGMDDNITVNLRVHPIDFVQAQLQEYTLYFCWVQRRAIVLYENNNACQKLPEPVRNLKQYEKQMYQFFEHGYFHDYTEMKLSPAPVQSKPNESAKCQTESAKAEEQPSLSRELQIKMAEFIEGHGAQATSTRLRRAMIDYITGATETGIPDEFRSILWDFEELMAFFDLAEKEQQARP